MSFSKKARTVHIGDIIESLERQNRQLLILLTTAQTVCALNPDADKVAELAEAVEVTRNILWPEAEG